MPVRHSRISTSQAGRRRRDTAARKPSVRHSKSPFNLRAIFAAAALFILYAGTIPFNFIGDTASAVAKLSHLPLNPLISPDTGRRVSIPDVAQNILLFMPFGALGFLASRQRRSNLVAIVLVTAVAAALSAAVETLQLFEVDRTTSVSDLCANILGALFGAAVALAAVKVSRRSLLRLQGLGLTDMPAFYPMLVAAIVLCIAAWEPFDFTLDVGTLVGRLRALHANPWQFVVVSDEGVEIVRYAIFGLAASIWLGQVGLRSAATVAAIGGAAVAVGLEASQWIIGSRMPGLEDATVHAAGVVAGVLLSRRWPFGRSPVFWCAVLWVATAAGAALQMLSPFAFVSQHRPFTWMPFYNYYEYFERASFETISHTFELMLIYFPVGFAIAQTVRRRTSRWIVALVATLLVAGPLEYLQGWVAGRYGDITDVGVAILGALGGVWTGDLGWRRFDGWAIDNRRHKFTLR